MTKKQKKQEVTVDETKAVALDMAIRQYGQTKTPEETTQAARTYEAFLAS